MDQVNRIWSSLSMQQRLSIALVVLAGAGTIFWLISWRAEANLRPLYQGMSSVDAAQALQTLQTAEIPYRLKEDGDTTIFVPSSRLAEARLLLAREGLPKTGRIGFELFDQTNFGTTDFAEQINYQRALEGEIERTIMTLGEVQRARVHITSPKDSVFSEYRQPAKASVLLTLRGAARMEGANVTAITHLVASAVEGLSPDQVTVVDDRGGLLNKPRNTADFASAPDAQIEYRMTLERNLVNKITQTLDPVLGFGNYRTGISVDVDFSGVEESEEIWDPNNSVMVTSQLTEEGSAGKLTGGVPGTAANLPDPPAQTASRAGATRRSESASYQSSRRVRHVNQPRGVIKRITLAVLLNQPSRWEGEGENAQLVFTPPQQEKIDVIKNLAANVAGIDAGRGDQITVESLPFDSAMSAQPPGAESQDEPYSLITDMRVIGGAAGVVVLLLGAGVWFVRRGKSKAAAPAVVQVAAPAQQTRALSSSPGRLSQLGSGDTEEELLESLRLASRSPVAAEALTKFLREEVNKDPQGATQLLRAWLDEEHAR